MIGQLTSLALTVAALLFALSLPLGDGDAGRALRRAAAFAFTMAFVPATILCLASRFFRRPHSTVAAIELFLAAFGALGVVIVISFAAYGLIGLRKHGGSQPSAHSDRYRYAKRRPEQEPEDHHGHDED